MFREHTRKEWGPEGYGRKVAAAIAEHAGKPTLAAAVEQIHRVAEEINMLMKWPELELKKLQQKAVPQELTLHRVPR